MTKKGALERGQVVIAYSPGSDIYCATDSGGRIVTSVGAVKWEAVGAFPGMFWRSVAWSDALGLFCVVGEYGRIITSPDGVVWALRDLGIARGGIYLNSVAWLADRGLFCATTASGRYVLLSADGITWTRHRRDGRSV